MREGIKETSERAQLGSYILQGSGDMVGSRLRRRRRRPRKSSAFLLRFRGILQKKILACKKELERMHGRDHAQKD
jgi:hypothetical protein